MDAVHVRLNQQDAAPAALVQVFFQGGVGDAGAIEAGAFVLDRDLRAPVGDARLDANLLAGVLLVTVLDGVDQGFFKRDADREGVVGAESVALNVGEDALLHVAAGVVVGGDGGFDYAGRGAVGPGRPGRMPRGSRGRGRGL